MVLRFIHKKLPAYENLVVRGCHMPLMCNLCNKQSETSEHFFLHCPFPIALWNWLHYIIEHNINISSILPIFDDYNKGWSPQCKLVIISMVIHIINTTWFSINNYIFNNIRETLSTTVAMTTANVSLVGNLKRFTTCLSISDFVILESFQSVNNHPKAPRILQVIWHSHILSWIKYNINATALGNPGLSGCAVIFRNNHWKSLGWFFFF